MEIAVDGNGNVYIAAYYNSRVVKETLSGGSYTQSVMPAGNSLGNTFGVALDGSGNVYISDVGHTRVLKEDFADPPTLNFDATNVGSTSSDSPQPVAVLNFGNAALTAAAPGLTVPPDFSLAPGSGTPPDCTTSFSLLANASCNLSIDFSPLSASIFSESLVLTDNALNVPSARQSITLNGTGTKITPVISWTAPAAITCGTALSAVQLDAASGGVAGTFVYTPALGAVLDAGAGQTLSVVFTPTSATDYNPASGSTAITVNKATPVITLTSTVGTLEAKTPVTFTATVTSSLNTPSGSINFYDGTTLMGPGALTLGMATYTTSNLADGSHSITAAYGGDSNFSALTSAAVTETVEDFAVTVSSGSSSTATVLPGGTASYALKIAPSGGVTFPSAITLAVSGLPPGATATFTPLSLAAGAGSTKVVLAVRLPTQSSSLRHRDRFAPRLSPLMIGMLLLPFAGRLRRSSLNSCSQRLKKWLAVALLASAIAASLVGLAACGARSSGFPVSTFYTLTITATSGSLSHSTTVTLIVEQQ